MSMSTASARLALCCLVLVSASGLAQAQTIYRIVGPDGKVTFSDKPPADVTGASATSANGKPVFAGAEAILPYELRQAVARYPVTLYSAANCAPCTAGRQLLQSRGIPFVEYTVSTAEDGEALQRLTGANNLPFLTIGGQKIKGFSDAEWSQFLSAANYPQASMLPSSYRNAPARPLVTVQKPATTRTEEGPARSEEPQAETAAPAEAPPTSPSNPGGIRF
jgi:glutaredoxin